MRALQLRLPFHASTKTSKGEDSGDRTQIRLAALGTRGQARSPQQLFQASANLAFIRDFAWVLFGAGLLQAIILDSLIAQAVSLIQAAFSALICVLAAIRSIRLRRIGVHLQDMSRKRTANRDSNAIDLDVDPL